MEEKTTPKVSIDVTENAPLIVDSTGCLREYGTVTLYPGGYIEFRISMKFTIDELIRKSPLDSDVGTRRNGAYDIYVKGADGASGENGANGRCGDNGGSGSNGVNGDPGTGGSPGQPGDRGPTLDLRIGDLKSDITILNTGGKGGDGGNGGSGGNGGNGGSGTTNGGNGGAAGNGGDGGKGGDGGTLTVTYKTSTGSGIICDNVAAAGGCGGSAGKAGNGGNGSGGGQHGQGGDTATKGIQGSFGAKGTFTVKEEK